MNRYKMHEPKIKNQFNIGDRIIANDREFFGHMNGSTGTITTIKGHDQCDVVFDNANFETHCYIKYIKLL